MWREATFFVVLSFGEGVGRDKHHTTHARAARPHGPSRPRRGMGVGCGPRASSANFWRNFFKYFLVH